MNDRSFLLDFIIFLYSHSYTHHLDLDIKAGHFFVLNRQQRVARIPTMADRYTAPSPYAGRQGFFSSAASSSSQHHGSAENGVDIDTVDYYDDNGVPAPHHLATSHSLSPYPSSPRFAPEMQELLSAPSGYLHPPSPYLPSLPSAPESLHGGAYMPSFDSHDSLYHKGGSYEDDEEDSLYSRRNSDAWGLYDTQHEGARTSLSLARERYIKRKSAAMTTSGDALDYVPPKPTLLSRLSPRQKWWLIGTASVASAVVFAIIIFFATRHNTNASIMESYSATGAPDSPSPNNGGATKGGKPTAGVVASDPKDPSKFTKDPRLHHSMYGLCYTPFNAQYPSCGATQSNVTEDIQIMSQLTSRLRLYGADCDTSQLVLEAIQQTKVDMQVFLAVWVDNNADTFQRQVDEIVDAVKKYGTDHIAGITVGNEYLLNGGSVTDLLARIASVNTTVNALPGLGKYIPIGTADAGSMVTLQLASGADYVMANVHPWFGGLPVDQAAQWVYEYTNTNAPPPLCSPLTNLPCTSPKQVGQPEQTKPA